MDATQLLDGGPNTNSRGRRIVRRRSRRRPQRVIIEDRDGIAVLTLPAGSQWDAADLVRLRDRAAALLAAHEPQIGVDLAGIECLPSGFFAQLHNWYDRGADVLLFHPEAAVRRMTWFRLFMVPSDLDTWQLSPAACRRPR